MNIAQKERILNVIERISKVKDEINNIHDDLKLTLEETENEKFAASGKINKLPEELQQTPENRYTIYKLLSTENKIKKTENCLFEINLNIHKMTKTLKDLIVLYVY